VSGTDQEPEVTAESPDAPVHTTGTDHVTVWRSNEADTPAFYRDLLGMPLVLRQPNLDDPDQTHLFFDTGDGRILTVFVGDRPSNRGGQRVGTGAVHHLCFSVDPERYEEVMAALDDAGHRYDVFDRGIFHSASAPRQRRDPGTTRTGSPSSARSAAAGRTLTR